MAIPYFTGSNDAGELRQYLNILIGYINGLSSGAGPSPGGATRTASVSGGNLQLLSSDSTVLVSNAGGAVTLLPPSPPAANQRILIVDASNTAGTANILFQGTVSGEVNPTLISAAGAFAGLLFTSGLIYRVQ